MVITIRQELVDALDLVNQAEDNYNNENKRKELLSKANVRLKDCERHVQGGLVLTNLNEAEQFIYDRLQVDIDVMW